MKVFKVDKWLGGLNNSDDPTKIADNELTTAKNIIIKKDGNIKRRNGYEEYLTTDNPLPTTATVSIQNIYQFISIDDEKWLIVIIGGKVYKYIDSGWQELGIGFDTEKKLGILMYYGDLIIYDKENGVFIYKNEIANSSAVVMTAIGTYIHAIGTGSFPDVDIEISPTSSEEVGKKLYDYINNVNFQGIYKNGISLYLLDHFADTWRIIKLNLLLEYQAQVIIDGGIPVDVEPKLIFVGNEIDVLVTQSVIKKYNKDTLAYISDLTLSAPTSVLSVYKPQNWLFMPVSSLTGLFPGTSQLHIDGKLDSSSVSFSTYDSIRGNDEHLYSLIFYVELINAANQIILQYTHASWRVYFYDESTGYYLMSDYINRKTYSNSSYFNINGGLSLRIRGWFARSGPNTNTPVQVRASVNGDILLRRELSGDATEKISINKSIPEFNIPTYQISDWSSKCAMAPYYYANGWKGVHGGPGVDGYAHRITNSYGNFWTTSAAYITTDQGYRLYQLGTIYQQWASSNINFADSTFNNTKFYIFIDASNVKKGYRYEGDSEAFGKDNINKMKITDNGNYLARINKSNRLEIVNLGRVNFGKDSAYYGPVSPTQKNALNMNANKFYFLYNDILHQLTLPSFASPSAGYNVSLTNIDKFNNGSFIFNQWANFQQAFKHVGAPGKCFYEILASGTLSGTAIYKISYVLNGVETVASNEIKIESLSLNQVRLFNMVVPDYIKDENTQNPGYFGKQRIYRKIPTSPNNETAFWLIAEITDINVIEYTDNSTSNLGVEYNQGIEDKYKFAFGKIYLNRLVLSGSNEYTSVLIYSEVDVLNDIPFANFREINKNDGDNITAIEPLQSQLFIFKTNNIYSIIGDVEDGGLNHLSKNIGCVHQNTVVSLKAITFFLDRSGFYMTDGNQVVKISGKISRFFDNDYEEKINLDYIANSRTIVNKFNSEVKWYLPAGYYTDETNQQQENQQITKILIYNYKLKLWREEFYAHNITEAAIIEENDNKLPVLLMGSDTGSIYKMTNINDDNGHTILWEVVTKAFTMGSNLYEKIFKKLFVVFNSRESFEIGYSVGLLEFINETIEAYGHLYNKNQIIRIMNGRGTEIQLKFNGGDYSSLVEIKEVQIYYLPLKSTGRGR